MKRSFFHKSRVSSVHALPVEEPMDIVPYESIAVLPTRSDPSKIRNASTYLQSQPELPIWMISPPYVGADGTPLPKHLQRRLRRAAPHDPDVKLTYLAFRRPPEGADILTRQPDRSALRKARVEIAIRKVIIAELLQCQTVTDILRLFSVCMLHTRTAAAFATVCDPLISALYRTRPYCSDARIANACSLIVKRLHMAGFHPESIMYATGARFAARSRKLNYMRFFLVQFRVHSLKMSRQLLRGIVAKLGINNNKWGAIRNGRWDRGDLLQILGGFDGAVGLEKTAHLGAYVIRKDWLQMHSWLKLLASVERPDLIWDELTEWKASDRRKEFYSDDFNKNPTNRMLNCRGDILFIRALWWAKDYDGAWLALQQAEEDKTVSPLLLFKFLVETTRDEPWRRKVYSQFSDADDLVQAMGEAWRQQRIIQGLQSKLEEVR